MTQLQEAIRDKITKYSDACGMCTDTTKECDTCGITCVLEDLNELQKSANNPDAVRPTAHWIAEFVSEVYGPEAAYGSRGDYICGYYCSNCHNEAILNEAGEDFTPKSCPECGAKMLNYEELTDNE